MNSKRMLNNQTQDKRPNERFQQTLKGVDAMTATEQILIDKIKQLAPRRKAEVEDFVDFLRARDDEQHLTADAAQASHASFAAVWNNDEDAVYDRM